MKSMEKLCKEMRDSNYDVTILDSQPEIVKKTFMILSKLIKNDKNVKINQQLSTCIYNHYYTQQPIARKVSGIGELSFLEYGDRKIYLFSDLTHSLDHSCETESMTIHEYLQKFFNTTDKFVDFYCEYSKTSRNISDSYLRRTELEFRSCSEGSNKPLKCPKNVRMHFADPRYSQDLDNPLIHFLEKEDRLWEDSDVFKYMNAINGYIRIISDVSGFNAFLARSIAKSKILTKELGKVDPSMKDMILDSVFKYSFTMMTDRIKNKDPIKTLIHFKEKVAFSSYVNKSLFCSDKLYEDYFYVASAAFVFFMDIYVLARMFKKFDVSNSYDPEYAKNIIMYAGASHSYFCRQFLLDLGYTEKYHKKYDKIGLQPTAENKSCLDISDIPQPLFSF